MEDTQPQAYSVCWETIPLLEEVSAYTTHSLPFQDVSFVHKYYCSYCYSYYLLWNKTKTDSNVPTDKVISNSSHTNLEKRKAVMGLVVIFLLTKLQTVNSYITAAWWGINRLITEQKKK